MVVMAGSSFPLWLLGSFVITEIKLIKLHLSCFVMHALKSLNPTEKKDTE